METPVMEINPGYGNSILLNLDFYVIKIPDNGNNPGNGNKLMLTEKFPLPGFDCTLILPLTIELFIFKDCICTVVHS